MSSVLLCWLTTSEVDIGSMAIEVEPSHQYSITFCCTVTDGSRGAVWQNGISWKCAWGKGMELNSLMWEKMAHIDIHWCFLNISEDPTVDVSTVRLWVVCFSSDDSNKKGKARSGQPWRLLRLQHAGSWALAKKHSSWWGLCWKIVFCS